MSYQSDIEWTETTWNPVTGCTPISDGCKNCYAARLAKRLKAMGNIRYKNGFKVTLHHDLIDAPLKWNKPRIIFVNSMSDLFHEEIPFEFISKVFSAMGKAPHHIFQVLTKRSERLMEISNSLAWPKNVWAGVTIESSKYLNRIDHLRTVPAEVKFLSVEPMLGPIKSLSLQGIDWVIVGGESGPGSRIMRVDWVKSVRDQCIKTDVPFFFKQWGGTNKKKTGKLLEGIEWKQFPVQSNAHFSSMKNS